MDVDRLCTCSMYAVVSCTGSFDCIICCRLQEDMMRLREEGERRIAQHSQDVVQGDLQLQSLQSTCDKLKEELTTRIQDIQRCNIMYSALLMISQ